MSLMNWACIYGFKEMGLEQPFLQSYIYKFYRIGFTYKNIQ